MVKKSLEKITLPDNLEEIGKHAFENCKNSKTINKFPPSLMLIGKEAFRFCDNLKHVDLSATKIKTMPCYVFSEIETIKLPRFLRTLDSNCFASCRNLKK